MPLQDLTPQLRTRLGRLERAVGLFVAVAALLMLVGLGYYIYQRAERRGWFLRNMPYFTFVRHATGLKVGDKVKLMGFDVGEILEITAQPPEDIYYNVFVQFQVREPYYGYLWEDSRARVASADWLGNRSIEVTKGTNGAPTYLFHEFREISLPEAATLINDPKAVISQEFFGNTGQLSRVGDRLTGQLLEQIAALGSNTLQVLLRGAEKKHPTGIWNDKAGRYDEYRRTTKGYFMEPEESPALTERVEGIVLLVETNLPGLLDLTNKLGAALTNAAAAASRATELLQGAAPAVTNLAAITATLREPKGALGEWLLPTNVHEQLLLALGAANTTLGSANTAVTNADVRVALLASNLNLTLEHLAGITSNLNAQVQANSNLVTSLNKSIIQGDEFIQGLRRHWLLRSAFKQKKTNPPPAQLKAPKDKP